jgi:cobaltochelatase CobN
VKAFPRFGYWHPDRGVTADFPTGTTSVPILFYRAALEGAGTATLEALIAEVARQGLHAIPILVSTLKEAACVRFVQRAFADHRPATILNLTGFALGLDGIQAKLNPFAGTDAPVIQLIQGGRPQAAWAADVQGLTAKDLAMQVVLPELDGRIGGILVGHKAEQVWHARTQCPLSAYAPEPDGIQRAVTLAANWARLRATPRAERKVAIVLANYPIRDGRLANGVGYDAPESTVLILQTLADAGYSLTPTPNPSPQGGGERARHRHSGNIERARRLRNNATIPERVLWPILKQFRIEGYHFRRQVPIGPYYTDFACHHPKLVVELDGDRHGTDAAEHYDTKRTAFLNAAGYHVLRVTNSDVATSPEGVWQVVSDVLARLPSPLRGGGGGGGRFVAPKAAGTSWQP